MHCSYVCSQLVMFCKLSWAHVGLLTDLCAAGMRQRIHQRVTTSFLAAAAAAAAAEPTNHLDLDTVEALVSCSPSTSGQGL
jgi:hypothetical protein